MACFIARIMTAMGHSEASLAQVLGRHGGSFNPPHAWIRRATHPTGAVRRAAGLPAPGPGLPHSGQIGQLRSKNRSPTIFDAGPTQTNRLAAHNAWRKKR